MKSSAINLVSTVFLLWFTIQIKSDFEIYLAFFFILTLGIVHGANDVALISLITENSKKIKYKYLMLYIGLVLLTTLTFIIVPTVALIIFVGFSCYHFGEQHFYAKLRTSQLKTMSLFVAYGILIFGLLFYLNAADTIVIIYELTEVRLEEVQLLYFLIVGILSTLFLVYLNLKNFKSDFEYFQETFLILLFALLFKLATLLWAFAIYFIIWHSLPSLKDQTLALYGKFNRSSFYQYIKASFLYWVISIVGLFIVYYISSYLQISFITLFFAFLAAITIPHVIVMYYLNKK